MQYFTEEARRGNFFSPEQKQKWEQVCLDYQQRFRGLESRLNKKVFNFYTKRDFHDFRLVNFQVIHGQVGEKNPVQVVLQLTDEEETWTLTYRKVRGLEMDFSQKEAYRGFEDVLYEEILDIDEHNMSHELFFASETSLRIAFPNKAMKMTRARS